MLLKEATLLKRFVTRFWNVAVGICLYRFSHKSARGQALILDEKGWCAARGLIHYLGFQWGQGWVQITLTSHACITLAWCTGIFLCWDRFGPLNSSKEKSLSYSTQKYWNTESNTFRKALIWMWWSGVRILLAIWCMSHWCYLVLISFALLYLAA